MLLAGALFLSLVAIAEQSSDDISSATIFFLLFFALALFFLAQVDWSHFLTCICTDMVARILYVYAKYIV